MSTHQWILVLLTALLSASLALADPGDNGGSGPSAKAAPEYAQAVELIKQTRYAEAIALLQGYVARAPNDANAHNWLGYSYRKSGHLDAAFTHYDRALAIDPRHRGAHEYVGEAYLMTGNLAKAEEHLKALDRLCFLPCEEYADLKKSITAYKANGNKVVGTN
jgi:Flp pilus assembly protein TadD